MKFFDRNIVILKLAQEIMRKPKAWTQSAWARDADDTALQDGSNFAMANSPEACAWCYAGAVMKAAGDLGYNEHDARAAISQCDRAYYEATNYKGAASLMSVNDEDGKAKTLAAMTKAINRLEKNFKAEQKAAKNC